MVTLQGMHSTNCPQMPDVGVTPCGYPFPWQAQGPAPTTPFVLICPYVGVTPCGYPFPWQAQHQLPSNARCRGKPPWVPSFRAGTGACPYDPKSHQTPGCRGNTPWLPIFWADTGVRPSAPITRFEGGHRGPPLRSRLLVCVTCLHDRKPLLPFLAHSLSKFALHHLDI